MLKRDARGTGTLQCMPITEALELKVERWDKKKKGKGGWQGRKKKRRRHKRISISRLASFHKPRPARQKTTLGR
jgi:hypothetical protein